MSTANTPGPCAATAKDATNDAPATREDLFLAAFIVAVIGAFVACGPMVCDWIAQ